MLALLVFACFVAIAGCWAVVADIRDEVRRFVRDYERGIARDIRSRVQ